MAPPHSRAPCAPQILELPLLLAIFGFSAAMMGLAGHDIHFLNGLKDKATINNLVRIEDNGILKVDLVLLIIAAISFAFSILALFLACAQFPGRRGERTGKGTYGYFLVGLVLLTLSGAWAGIASAYTAFSVMKRLTFSRGPAYAEPFTDGQKLFLRSIYEQFRNSQGSATPTGTVHGLSALGVWADINTIDQANAFLNRNRYLDYRTYRATVAISWVTLATVFFVMVVHFALPLVLNALGMTRPPKGEKAAQSSRVSERRSHRGYEQYA